MQEVIINGSDFDTTEEVFEFLAEELDWPYGYKRSLSALYDVLTELSDDTRIVLNLSGVEDDKMIEMLERMAEVLTDAADAGEYLEVSIE
ncbi:MAG: barstar family protein [Blautia sp.]|nr:barstar family protein [Blautia sp.]MDY3999874.1 barstar family protein [Blautia sp.]